MGIYLSKEVMRNDILRKAFNVLAVRTFGFSFEDWYQNGYKKTNPFSRMQVIDNYGLLMFYCTSWMRDCIYYSPEYDAVVIAEQNHDKLKCFDVYCDQRDCLPDILSSIAETGTKTFGLEFTPYDDSRFDMSLRDDREDVLFVLSEGEKMVWDSGKLLFPSISHT